MPADQPTGKLKLAITIAAALGVAVLLGLFTYGLVHLKTVGERVDANQRANTTALCALRSDLQGRVNSSNDFLDKHPHGFSGISAATIKTSIVNEQRTIQALSPIVCPPVPAPNRGRKGRR